LTLIQPNPPELQRHDELHGTELAVSPPKPLQILVAEDNPTNQKLVVRMLDRLGYHADVAGNGLEVLEALARQRYDLIFMDIEMPEMNGLEATRQIRQRWPGAQGPRIVAVTAETSLQEKEACLAVGVDDFVGKPIPLGALVASLQKCQGETPPGQGVSAPPTSTVEPKAAPVPSTQENLPSPSQRAGLLNPNALAAMKAMVGGQNALVAALIDSALQDAPQLLHQMRQALEAENAVELKRAAHTLKSLANSFGAMTLGQYCKELEMLGKAGTLQGATEPMHQAETEYEQVKIALEAARLTYYE
jgi:CheY-like chemotaxis protein